MARARHMAPVFGGSEWLVHMLSNFLYELSCAHYYMMRLSMTSLLRT